MKADGWQLPKYGFASDFNIVSVVHKVRKFYLLPLLQPIHPTIYTSTGANLE